MDRSAATTAERVAEHLATLQDTLCAALEEVDGTARFAGPERVTPGGGRQRPRVLQEGRHIEKAAVHYSHTRAAGLPAAATERRPELAGQPYEAVSVSLIVHPRNPHAPTSHANFRYFEARTAWWFGGGFDLTPYYGYEEDCQHWHARARQACARLGPGAHAEFKAACDRYFHLPHRGEARGIGGIFYDDLDRGGFEHCFAFHRAASEAYLGAYLPILRRRLDRPYGERERRWQCLRRGRYVEFNLLHDRGTRFGLESGAPVESVLASLPPVVHWAHDHRPAAGSPEERLLTHFLVPRDWTATP